MFCCLIKQVWDTYLVLYFVSALFLELEKKRLFFLINKEIFRLINNKLCKLWEG